jgi:hypothetical protein
MNLETSSLICNTLMLPQIYVSSSHWCFGQEICGRSEMISLVRTSEAVGAAVHSVTYNLFGSNFQ